MHTEEKTQIVDALFAVIASGAYAQRLTHIHKHYPNLKSEGRYRDALLELFNDRQEQLDSGLRAYAEADRVDMVVTKAGPAEGDFRRLRIELKYHFTYDLYHRVEAALPAFLAVPPGANALERLRALGRGDLRGIALDCLAPKGEAPRCDLFILVVQDRRRDADATAQVPARRAKAVPRVHQRGVTIQFLDEQIRFDGQHADADANRRAWTTPLQSMLRHIHLHRPFRLIDVPPHVMPDLHAGVPLTSHIFGLDFSSAQAAFPAPAVRGATDLS